MTDIAKLNQAKEAITKRHTFEIRKMGDEVEHEMKTTRTKNEKDIAKMKKGTVMGGRNEVGVRVEELLSREAKL